MKDDIVDFPSEISLKKEQNFELSLEEKHFLTEQNFKFFLEYEKLYNVNILLRDKLNQLIVEKNRLKLYIKNLEKKNNSIKIKNINDTYTKRKVNK